MIARDPRERWDYVCAEDLDAEGKPKPDATVFHLRHLTLLQEQQLLNKLTIADSGALIRSDLGDAYMQTLRNGLVGWSNMRGKGGATVECKSANGVVLDESLMRLSVGVRSELARAIENEIAVETVELGKSEQPSG